MPARPSVVACLSVAVSAAVLTAQDAPPAPQQPTFRSAIQSVRVDLYAMQNGQPVGDLRLEEIQLLEDGVAQAIQTFERITYAAASAMPPSEPRTLDESRRLAADPRSRLFVVFLPTPDAGYLLGPTTLHRSLFVDPLNRLLGPDDLVAVMTPYTRVSDLTFHRRLPANETRLFSDAEIADPKHQLWDACYPPTAPGSPNGEMKARHLELRTFEALDALIVHLGGLREERKHLLLLTDGFRLYIENAALAARGGRSLPGFPGGRGPRGMGTLPRLGESTAVTTDALRECEEDLMALASLDHRNRLQDLATAATRNNVSLTPVSLARMAAQTTAAGTSTVRGTYVDATVLERQASLRALAERTGGTPIVNTNDVEGNLRRMVFTTSAYYLLGYTPTNTARDGTFRRISVRIERPGLSLHARSGYTAAAQPEPARESRGTAKPPNPVAAAVAAMAGAALDRPLRVRAATWMQVNQDGRPEGSLWIIGELDPQQWTGRRSPGTLTAQLTLRPSVGGQSITRRVDLPDGASSFTFELANEKLVPGSYSVRVSVAGADGEVTSDIRDVVLPDSPAPLAEPLVLRRGPGTGAQYVATVDPRVRRNERLRLELVTGSSDSASAVLRDSKGALLPVPLTVTHRADESARLRWLVVDVPVAPLAPAVYAVEVTQGPASRVAAFRVVP